MDSRTDFTDTWLTEAPEGFGDTELIDMLIYNIADQLKRGAKKLLWDLVTTKFRQKIHCITGMNQLERFSWQQNFQ